MPRSRLPGEQYAVLVERAPVLVWRAGPDARFDYVNDTWLAFTGRALADELGDGWARGVHPEDVGRCVAAYLDHVARRAPFEIECRLRRHDGAYRYLLVRGAPFDDERGAF